MSNTSNNIVSHSGGETPGPIPNPASFGPSTYRAVLRYASPREPRFAAMILLRFTVSFPLRIPYQGPYL